MDASEQDEATSEEEEIYDQDETAFEVNPEESSLKTSTIIAHFNMSYGKTCLSRISVLS